MKITKIYFNYLRNEAHYQFLLLVQNLFERYPAVAATVADLRVRFYELLLLEGRLVDALRASEYTAELAEADRRVDRDIVGINAAVKSALHHFDPDVVKAAQMLELRLKSFRGEIEKKSCEEESAAVKILVAELQTTYAAQVVQIGIGGWVTELAGRPQERLKDVRRQIEAVYRLMVERIDAYGIINGDAATAPFVEELNREVAYFNEHDRHHAKIDIAHAVVASIPDQPYANGGYIYNKYMSGAGIRGGTIKATGGSNASDIGKGRGNVYPTPSPQAVSLWAIT